MEREPLQHAVLDDGSQRTILLQSAAQQLHLDGEAEELSLRTVCQDVEIVHGCRRTTAFWNSFPHEIKDKWTERLVYTPSVTLLFS